ncbi:hypothetical protein ACTVJH_13740 [Desulfoplanes sp. PS50]
MAEDNDFTVDLIGKSEIKNQFVGSFGNFKILCAFYYEFYRHYSHKINFSTTTKIVKKSPCITFISNPEIFIYGEYAYYVVQSIRRAASEYYYRFNDNYRACYWYNVKGFFNDIEYCYRSNMSVSKKYKDTIEVNFSGRPIHSEKNDIDSFEVLDYYDLYDMYFVEKLMKHAFNCFAISTA